VTPPDGFTRLTAQVLDGKGQPLAGLNVRVEGQDTGVTTGSDGSFSLPAGAFPNGVNASNEILLGKGGVVIGSETLSRVTMRTSRSASTPLRPALRPCRAWRSTRSAARV